MSIVCISGASIVAKNVAGMGWLMTSLSLRPIGPVRWIARLAPLTFGVYLVHPLVMGVLRSAMLKVGFPNDGIFDVLIFTLTIPASFGLTAAIRRTALFRPLVP